MSPREGRISLPSHCFLLVGFFTLAFVAFYDGGYLRATSICEKCVGCLEKKVEKSGILGI